ncbi:hypothetical protein MWN33_09835 [Starkeya koreensis]|uniref:PepSY domain-containing protein n=1 Tax=Ancylobacter koreensis TaxID=266121 RepID=A0ABT0DM22_9HYPH|nr:hypothetical protein [Ancylobacter koreensis]MCK0208332.1 hypothetical protein [Ancylobacter koreensis]
MRRAAVVAMMAAGLAMAPLAAGLPGRAALAQGFVPPPGPYAPNPGPYAPYEAPAAPRAGAGGPVDADAAARMLSARGFTNISVVRRRGATIILEANGPRGERVQVVVDGTSGAISGMKVIGFGDKRY